MNNRSLWLRPQVVRGTALRCIAAGLLTMALAGGGKVSADLSHVNATATVDVIVQFKGERTDRQDQQVGKNGGLLKANLGVIRAGVYSVKAGDLDDISKDPDVLYISPDRQIHGSLDYANSTIGADLARQAGFDGTGVSVAVIDSGITQRPDLNKTARITNRLQRQLCAGRQQNG